LRQNLQQVAPNQEKPHTTPLHSLIYSIYISVDYTGCEGCGVGGGRMMASSDTTSRRTAEFWMISAESPCWEIERNSQIFNEDFYLPLYLPLCFSPSLYSWSLKPGKGKRYYTRSLLTFPVLLIPETWEGEEILHQVTSHLPCTPNPWSPGRGRDSTPHFSPSLYSQSLKPGKGKRYYTRSIPTFPVLLIPEAREREEILHHTSHLLWTPDPWNLGRGRDSTLHFSPSLNSWSLKPGKGKRYYTRSLLTFLELLIPEAREREVVFVLVQIDLHCWIKVRFHFLKAILYLIKILFLTPPFCERHEKPGETGFKEHASHGSAWRGIFLYICTVQ
jgi:hypothetical protein